MPTHEEMGFKFRETLDTVIVEVDGPHGTESICMNIEQASQIASALHALVHTRNNPELQKNQKEIEQKADEELQQDILVAVSSLGVLQDHYEEEENYDLHDLLKLILDGRIAKENTLVADRLFVLLVKEAEYTREHARLLISRSYEFNREELDDIPLNDKS
jgi:hypothetical protein